MPREDEVDLPTDAEEQDHGLDLGCVQDLSGAKLSTTQRDCSSAEADRPPPAANDATSEVDAVTVHFTEVSASQSSREGSVNTEDIPPRNETALAATVSLASISCSLQVCPIPLLAEVQANPS